MKRLPTLAIAFALAAILLCHSASGQGPSSRVAVHSGFAPDGVLTPWKTSDVACSETGIIADLKVSSGQRVSAGDVLATLDSTAVEMQLAIARSQAASSGREQSIRADVELNRKRVLSAQDARRNQYGSQTELERAEAELQIAQGRLVAELEEKDILQLQVVRLEQQLKQRTVISPMDGDVVELHKEVGEFVAPNSPEVVRIVDVSRLRGTFFLKMEEARRLENINTIKVRLSNGQEVQSAIEQIAPVADSESGLIEVRVLIENPKNKRLGSRCTLLLSSL